MTTTSTLRLLLLTSLLVIGRWSLVIAQGPLTPPGAPAPTLKTLDQVETRTPISGVPFTINVAGSYYLTRSFAVPSGNAITINADDVTLDLNGFTLSSTASPAAGTGIFFPSGTFRNVLIRNGHIRGTTTFSAGTFTKGGFLDGISSFAVTTNTRVVEVQVSGVAGNGIRIGAGGIRTTTIERCHADVCSGIGLTASIIRDSAAQICGLQGLLGDTVIDSFGHSAGPNSFNHGIEATTVINSVGEAGNGDGILCRTATHSDGTSISGNGLAASGTASFCHGTTNGAGAALSASIATGCTASGGSGVSAPNKSLGTP